MAKLTRALIAALFLFTGWSSVSAETIAVIGTGNVGGALGPRFSELGHDIIYGSRQPQRTDVQALVRDPQRSLISQRLHRERLVHLDEAVVGDGAALALHDPRHRGGLPVGPPAKQLRGPAPIPRDLGQQPDQAGPGDDRNRRFG